LEVLLIHVADINSNVRYRFGNTLRFPGRLLTPDDRTYQWNILEAFLAQNIYLYVNPYSLDMC